MAKALDSRAAPGKSGLHARGEGERVLALALEAAQGAPRAPRRDSRGERSPWLPLETRPDSPGANAGDMSLISGLGISPGEGNENPHQYSCWEIPWTEEPGRLQSVGSQKSRTQHSD